MKRVLFICTHNSARSQMAEAFLNHLYGDEYTAESAGTVATRVNPYAIRAMEEIGISMDSHRSKSIEEFRGQKFDVVVTVCDNARENCPFFPGRVVMHRGFDDPAAAEGTEEEILAAFRRARDEIRDWIKEEFGKDEIGPSQPSLNMGGKGNE